MQKDHALKKLKIKDCNQNMYSTLLALILPILIIGAMLFMELQLNLITGKPTFQFNSYPAIGLIVIIFFSLAKKMLSDEHYEYYYYLNISIAVLVVISYHVLNKFYQTAPKKQLHFDKRENLLRH